MKSKNYWNYAWKKKREVVYQTLEVVLDRLGDEVRLLDMGCCNNGSQTKEL